MGFICTQGSPSLSPKTVQCLHAVCLTCLLSLFNRKEVYFMDHKNVILGFMQTLVTKLSLLYLFFWEIAKQSEVKCRAVHQVVR